MRCILLIVLSGLALMAWAQDGNSDCLGQSVSYVMKENSNCEIIRNGLKDAVPSVTFKCNGRKIVYAFDPTEYGLCAMVTIRDDESFIDLVKSEIINSGGKLISSSYKVGEQVMAVYKWRDIYYYFNEGPSKEGDYIVSYTRMRL